MWLTPYTTAEVTPFRRFHYEAYCPFTPLLTHISKNIYHFEATKYSHALGKNVRRKKRPRRDCAETFLHFTSFTQKS